MTTTPTPTAPPAPKAPVIDPKAKTPPTPPPEKAGADNGQPPAGGQPPATGAAAVKAATDAAIRKYKHVVIDDTGEKEVTLADILKDHKEKILEDGQEVEVPFEELKKGYQGVLVRRPEAGGVRGQDLVDQVETAGLVLAELELGVGDDDAPGAGIIGALGVDGQGGITHLVGQIAAQEGDGLDSVNCRVGNTRTPVATVTSNC